MKRASKKPIEKLSDSQVVALSDFIREKGKYWRKHFENTPDTDLDPRLKTVRDKHGHIIVHQLDTNEVHDDAQKVREAC